MFVFQNLIHSSNTDVLSTIYFPKQETASVGILLSCMKYRQNID